LNQNDHRTSGSKEILDKQSKASTAAAVWSNAGSTNYNQKQKTYARDMRVFQDDPSEGTESQGVANQITTQRNKVILVEKEAKKIVTYRIIADQTCCV
jgi:hypothetical protein